MKIINCQTLGEVCSSLLDGEPVFVLRAQDKISVEILEYYRNITAASGGANVGRTQSSINAFLKWQNENPGRVKLPD